MTASLRSVAALATLVVGCTSTVSPPLPMTVDITATVLTRDFQTAFELDDPRLTDVREIPAPHFIVQREVDGGRLLSRADLRAMDTAAFEGITLVDVASGSRVQGDVVVGFADWTGTHSVAAEARAYAYSFVPASPLADGWYVLRVDVSGWRPFASSLRMAVASEHLVRDTDIAHVRIHVGALPTFWATYVSCTSNPAQPTINTACELGALLTESILDWGATTLEVRVDGSATACVVGSDDRSIGCRLAPFQIGAILDVHFVSDVVTAPDGAHDVTQHFAFEPTGTGGEYVYVAPDFGIAISDGAR